MKHLLKKKLLITLITISSMWANAQNLELVFNTNLSSGTTITLPLQGTVDVTVDWGDGGSSQAINSAGNIDHKYTTEGEYTVKISGKLSQFGNGYSGDNTGYKNSEKLIKVTNFGDLGIKSFLGAFYNALNLKEVPNTIPTTVTNISGMFYGAINFNDNNIGNWNVSNVENMEATFANAKKFNADISNWNVSKVTNMAGLFVVAINFNQDISGWKVGEVTDMSNMFLAAMKFNQDISGWDVQKVTNMDAMFQNAMEFNQDIGDWNVENVTNMKSLFDGAEKFNGDISRWVVKNVKSMKYMFRSANAFNQNIGNWNVSNVKDMKLMFAFTELFDQNIGSWKVDSVKNMSSMFYMAKKFNQDISGWKVDSVKDMSSMFEFAESFNQDIGNWTVSEVTNMKRMFVGATKFDQNIGNWDISNVANMDDMFNNVTLSTANYDSLLIGWAKRTVKDGIKFSAGNSKYSCKSFSAREKLQNKYSWDITDKGFINDTTNPVISSTHSDQSVEANDNCRGTLPDYKSTVVATDNCDNSLTIKQKPEAGTMIEGATNTVTLTAYDNAGNKAEVSFNVAVSDKTAPKITCIEDKTVTASESGYYTVNSIELDANSISDNCGKPKMNNDFNNTETLANAQIPVGTRTITWTATDDAGNTTTCSFTITVKTFVGIKSLQTTNIAIYPNPTNGIININFAKNNIQKIAIYDITNKKILEKTPLKQIETINLHNLANGVYILKIEQSNNIFTTKIIKQ